MLLTSTISAACLAQDIGPVAPEVSVAETPDSSTADPDDRYQLEYESYLGDPQEAGRKGLAEGASPPWYLKDADVAVPVGISSEGPEPYRDPVDPGNRDSDWLAKPSATPPAGGPGTVGGAISQLPITGLVWTLLILLLTALAGLLLWALLRGERKPAGAADPFDPDAEEDPAEVQDRIERLPFEVRPGVGDFLEEARRLAASGKYEEALVYLFSHALVQLDRAHRIRLAKGKTNRQYVAEIESNPPLAQSFGELVEEFERVFFGKYRLPQAKYEENLARLQRFGALLEQASRG